MTGRRFPTHTTRVIPAEPETRDHDPAYRIDCSVCGTVASHSTHLVADSVARRHESRFSNLAAQRRCWRADR